MNRVLAGLRRLFNFAVFSQYLEENPFPKAPKSGLFYPEKKGLRLFFTEDQVEKILVASPPWLRPIILANYFTGLRQGELLNLQREWIDRHTGVIYLPSTKTLKDPTGRGQMIVMPKALADLIDGLTKKSGYVFCQPNGQPYKQWHVYKAFKKVLKAVGIDSRRYSWKELRHSTASQMHLKGVDVTAIKDQLRHSSSRTTENFYIGSDVSYQREQIEKLSSERFRGFLAGSKENSEKPVKKEVDFETFQEVPPFASA